MVFPNRRHSYCYSVLYSSGRRSAEPQLRAPVIQEYNNDRLVNSELLPEGTWFYDFLSQDPARSADASLQWLDFGLLDPMPELELAAVNADGPTNVSSELSSQLCGADTEGPSVPPYTGKHLDSVEYHVSDAPPEATNGIDTLALQAEIPYAIEQDVVLSPAATPAIIVPSSQPQLSAKDARVLQRSSRPFRCTHCTASFVMQRQVKNHERNLHKRFPCTFSGCSMEYRHYKSLWQHEREAHKQFKIQCDICDYTTGRDWNLKRHKVNKHGQENGPAN